MAVYPGLQHSGRPYEQVREESVWVLKPAHELLAGHVVSRQVDRSGCVSVYNRNYYVGKKQAGQEGFVGFDPQQRRWLFYDKDNRLLNHRDAEEVSDANIRALTVTHRRDRSGGKKTGTT
jgi:hypothetical protein